MTLIKGSWRTLPFGYRLIVKVMGTGGYFYPAPVPNAESKQHCLRQQEFFLLGERKADMLFPMKPL